MTVIPASPHSFDETAKDNYLPLLWHKHSIKAVGGQGFSDILCYRTE